LHTEGSQNNNDRKLILRPMVFSVYLVPSENAEGLHHLVRSVLVGRFLRHEVQERVKTHVTQVIRVDDSHDALEVCITLCQTHSSNARSHPWRSGNAMCRFNNTTPGPVST